MSTCVYGVPSAVTLFMFHVLMDGGFLYVHTPAGVRDAIRHGMLITTCLSVVCMIRECTGVGKLAFVVIYHVTIF